MSVRVAELAGRRGGIRTLDTSFATDRVYRFGRERGGFGFALPLVTRAPLARSYRLPEIDPGDGAFVAEVDLQLPGEFALFFARTP